MGCLPLEVKTHFCLTRGSKRWLVIEMHLTVLCIAETVYSHVVIRVNTITLLELH